MAKKTTLKLSVWLAAVFIVRAYAGCPIAVLQSKAASAEGWKVGYQEFVSYDALKIKIYKKKKTQHWGLSVGHKPNLLTHTASYDWTVEKLAVLQEPITFTPMIVGGCKMPASTELDTICTGNYTRHLSNGDFDCSLTDSGPPCVSTGTCTVGPGLNIYSYLIAPNWDVGVINSPPPVILPQSRVDINTINSATIPNKTIYRYDDTTTLTDEFTTENLASQIRNRIPSYPSNFSDGGAQAFFALSESEVCGAGGAVKYRFKAKGDAGKRINIEGSKSHYNKRGQLIATAPITLYANGAGQDTWVYTDEREEMVPSSEGRVVIAYVGA